MVQLLTYMLHSSAKWYVFLGICVIAFLLRILKKINTVSKQKQEMRKAAEEQARDEGLNNLILNTWDTETTKKVSTPYDVDYGSAINQSDSGTKKNRDGAKTTMVQIVERTNLSTRKYLLNASNGITIGNTNDNDISFMSSDANVYRCIIISAQNGDTYVKSLESGRIVLRRKKNQVIVDARGIKIVSGDEVVIDEMSYVITIVK